jgi:hypothetical protein
LRNGNSDTALKALQIRMCCPTKFQFSSQEQMRREDEKLEEHDIGKIANRKID